MQLKIIVPILLLCSIKVCIVKTQTLPTVSDDDILELIRDNEKLIVFFSKTNCPTCSDIEKVVENLKDDFKKHLNAVSVKTVNSHLARLYNPSKDPSIVFFRHGVPLLYSGPTDENELYSFFEKNQSPAVKELTDKIFEHMTQAATGATTGDWFVMFYGASCVECQRLHAVWESVGASLRGRINVARVDATLAGQNTAKRFHVTKLPTFLLLTAIWNLVSIVVAIFYSFHDFIAHNYIAPYRIHDDKEDMSEISKNCSLFDDLINTTASASFRLGKMYRYDLPKSDVKSFITFAQDWYKNYKGAQVPLLASPFDEVVDWCVEIIKFSISYGLDILAKYPWIWQIGLTGFGLVALTAFIAMWKAGKTRPLKVTRKDKKSK